LTGGGFATRYVLEIAEKEFVPYTEELKEIKRIRVLNTQDGYRVSVCFNAILAYTPEISDYQISTPFKRDFTGHGTRTTPREQLEIGCKDIEGSSDLLADARAGKEYSEKPYYRLGGTYCWPGESSAMLALGCFVNPKQKWGLVEIALAAPTHQYNDNSDYLYLLPIAWIVDVVLSPIYVIYLTFIASLFLLWAAAGGGVPGYP
jgi:hypothetical protein